MTLKGEKEVVRTRFMIKAQHFQSFTRFSFHIYESKLSNEDQANRI